jgi:hypothetical protein
MDVGKSQTLGGWFSVSGPDSSPRGLISHSPTQYGEHFQDHFLEQYKLYVESAQTVTERRLHSGNFFLAINSSLVAVFGVVLSSFGKHRWNVTIPVTGILVSILWYRIVKSYKDLNGVKFKVIEEMEKHLPAAPFRHEWQECGHGKDKTKYRLLTHSEQWVPVLFMVLYSVLALYAIFAPATISKP